MQAITVSQAKELYKNIGKIDLNSAQVKEAISSNKSKGPKVSEQQIAIAAKISANCTEEEFVDFVTKGEFPSVKLTKDEMEVLKGGVDPVSACILIGMGCYFVGKLIFR